MVNENMLKEIFGQAKKVYNSLMDEKSKKFFTLRMLYNLTGDWNYIKNMVSQIPEFESISLHRYIEFFIKCQRFTSENRKLIIYGAGKWAECFYNLCSYGIEWYCFCDKDLNKQEGTFCNLPVISPEQLINDYKNDIVVIGTSKYKDEIYSELVSMGFNSENILCNNGDPFLGVHFLSNKQYFESDFIMPQENEVFVDAGCYNCDTSLMFKKWCKEKYEKIYAFEPDNSNYEKCKDNINKSGIENIELFNAGLWSKNDILCFNGGGNGGSSISENGDCNINVVSLDEVLDGNRVSFIKMDIEGAELEALKGAKNTIITYRPRLAICIYHKPEDILEIPLYLQSLVPDYKFYVRHYSNYSIETVLYAI